MDYLSSSKAVIKSWMTQPWQHKISRRDSPDSRHIIEPGGRIRKGGKGKMTRKEQTSVMREDIVLLTLRSHFKNLNAMRYLLSS